MMAQQSNERYCRLCERCGVAVSIETTAQADAPVYQLQKASGRHIIRINRATITPSSYESFLGYVVSLVLLPENIPSIRLLEKPGFHREGLRHRALWHEALEQPADLVYYYRDR